MRERRRTVRQGRGRRCDHTNRQEETNAGTEDSATPNIVSRLAIKPASPSAALLLCSFWSLSSSMLRFWDLAEVVEVLIGRDRGGCFAFCQAFYFGLLVARWLFFIEVHVDDFVVAALALIVRTKCAGNTHHY